MLDAEQILNRMGKRKLIRYDQESGKIEKKSYRS